MAQWVKRGSVGRATALVCVLPRLSALGLPTNHRRDPPTLPCGLGIDEVTFGAPVTRASPVAAWTITAAQQFTVYC